MILSMTTRTLLCRMKLALNLGYHGCNSPIRGWVQATFGRDLGMVSEFQR